MIERRKRPANFRTFPGVSGLHLDLHPVFLEVSPRCQFSQRLENSVVAFAETQTATAGARLLVRDPFFQSEHPEHAETSFVALDFEKLLVVFDQAGRTMFQFPDGQTVVFLEIASVVKVWHH